MFTHFCPQNHTTRYVANGFIWYFFSWYMISANVLGIIFSGLCFLVLLKHPRVFTPTSRTWFLILTACDFLILLIAANDMYAEVMFTHGYHKLLGLVFGRYTCLIRVQTIVCLLWTSNLLQTGLSIERLASVIAPFKTRVIFTGRATRCSIGWLVTFSCISGILITILSSKPSSSTHHGLSSPNQTLVDYEAMVSCERRNVSELINSSTIQIDLTKLVYNVDLIIFRVIPFIIMLISSAVIASLIRTQRRKRSKLVRTSSLVQKRNRTIGYNRESRASLILLTINVTTLLTNPLFLLFELLDGEGSEGRITAKLTGDICISWILRHYFNSLIYFGNQINWVFYLTFGARFRVHIKNMLMCRNQSRAAKVYGNLNSELPNHKLHLSRGLLRKQSNVLQKWNSYSHQRPNHRDEDEWDEKNAYRSHGIKTPHLTKPIEKTKKELC